jgi:hypothetical protein
MESLIANQAVHFGAEMSAARSLKFTQSSGTLRIIQSHCIFALPLI